jgi:RNA polymerase sigma-70 factor (ECF subfamily)
MNEHRDAELIQAFQRGDERAFNELVHRYQERIYWLARRFVGSHDEADEIVQEVFCKVYDALKEFRGDSSFYTWVYRITVNASLNELRRNRVRDFFRLNQLIEQQESSDEHPVEAVERTEQRALIEQAIATLPDKQRAVFLMRYYDELSYEEISKILKTSVGGLKANYFHAVKKIGEYLKRAHSTSDKPPTRLRA